MSRDEFTKLFRFMSEKFDAIDRRLDKIERDGVEFRQTMIELGIRLEDNFQEDAVRDIQSGRLVDWAHRVGKKVNIPLKDL